LTPHSDPGRRHAARRRIWLKAGAEKKWLPLLAGLTYAVLGWRQRWTADDGFITLRVVRQVLAGHGPVYNSGERVESATSAAWAYVLAVAHAVTRIPLPQLAMILGLLLGALGIMAAVRGSLRIQDTRLQETGRVGTARALPATVLVPLALPPFWEFATAGLEGGLVLAWLGGSWLFLVSVGLDEKPRTRRLALCAAVIGAGPLVRPELLLVSAVFVVTLLVLPAGRPARSGSRASGLRAKGLLLLSALALPLLYELFRMSYYATLTPTPALAKESARPWWEQGYAYARDFIDPYWLWVPALMVILLVAALGWRLDRRHRALMAAPLVAGLLVWLYVMRVGGDFMHARLLLPAVFLLCLPAAVVVTPLKSVTSAGVAVVVVWAVIVAGFLRTHNEYWRKGIVDERRVYVNITGHRHPLTVADYLDSPTGRRFLELRDAQRSGRYSVAALGFDRVDLLPRKPQDPPGVIAVSTIGVPGQVADLDVRVFDELGLAQPIVARLERGPHGRPGHEKLIPIPWLYALTTSPGTRVPAVVAPDELQAARHALTCGPLRRLTSDVSRPWSLGSAWHNVRDSVANTRLRIPRDPQVAERRFCGAGARP
jgi:arabinofuranosyltransferase